MGKSTLFNRLTGSRRAIVGDEPGITRDRLYSEVNWDGRLLRVVDTGGIVPDDKALIPAEIFRQAKVALEESNAVVMVVDARTELASPDMELARLLQRLGKPLFLAVNKVDSAKQEAAAQNFRTLGIREVFPIAAEHGLGTMELMDAIMEVVPVVTAPMSRNISAMVQRTCQQEMSRKNLQRQLPRLRLPKRRKKKQRWRS